MTGYYRRVNPALRARALRAYAAYDAEAKKRPPVPAGAPPVVSRLQTLIAAGSLDHVVEDALARLWQAIALMRARPAKPPARATAPRQADCRPKANPRHRSERV